MTTLNLSILQGETYTLAMTWNIDAAPVNLTGYTARMQLRARRDSTATLVSLTSSSGIALGGSAGTITVTLTATQTSALPVGSAVYDLELVNGATVRRLLEGTVLVSGEVTR